MPKKSSAKKSAAKKGAKSKKTPTKAASEKSGKNPVKVMDTTLRDGHQSLLATRLRMEDMVPLLKEMNKIGFAAMEVWGGATFDSTTRFLNEDPWERLTTFKKYLPDTPIQMLLRGQNLVGYRHYADDVVDAFVEKTAECGLDIFRVFDALNDERNMKQSFKAIKKTGKQIQGTICYSLTERRLGGPIYNIDYYTGKAKTLEDMGADSICLKDMAGLLAPPDAYELISALKDAVKIPIQLHTHYTSGMGSMTYLKAVEAGVDIIDCALSPLALRTSQPAIEPILVALEGEERDPGLDLEKLIEMGERLERSAPKYCDLLDTSCMSVIDAGVLQHQIPGGMRSNLNSQLKEQGALDRIHDVFEELPKTRADMGFPPLVTPSSQIVGTQAVMNVLFGRYEQITQPVKDYMAGLYGRPPAKVNSEIQKKALTGHKYKKPIKGRPADLLEPEMDNAREAVKNITEDLGDILIYALYPTTGIQFLEWKYGIKEPPAEVKPKSLEDAKKEREMVEKAKKGLLIEPECKMAPDKSENTRTFNVFIDGEYYEVEVDPVGGISVAPPVAQTQSKPAPPKASGGGAAQKPSQPAPNKGAVKCGPGGVAAPMPGIVIEYTVKEGDSVEEGDVLLILEAMKMQNEIKAPVGGTVSKITKKPGERVDKGEALIEIEV